MKQRLENSFYTKDEMIYYIFEEYGEQIKRLIFTYVKSYSQTDDLFQEFLMKTYQNLDQFQARSSLLTWLYRIAINVCKDFLRSPINRLFLLNDQVKTFKKVESAEKQYFVRTDYIEMVEAILSMPIKYREVFVLRFYKGLNMKEISETLKVDESTIRSRIQRGRKMLRKKFGGDLIE